MIRNSCHLFFGFGSVLYALIETYPEKVTNLTKNYRMSDDTLSNIDSIISRHTLPDIKQLKELEDVIKSYLTDKDDFVMTTFRNDDVEFLNKTTLQILTHRDEIDDMSYLCELAVNAGHVIPVRSNQRQSYKDKNGNSVDIMFNNELCTLTKIGNQYVVQSKMFKDHQITYSNIFAILKDFSVSYAVTVHRSQGLEWDYAVYVHSNAAAIRMSANLCYVAYTRSRIKSSIFGDTSRAYCRQQLAYMNILDKKR